MDILLFIVPILVVFYFLMIRPQRKQKNEKIVMLKNMQIGDVFIMGGSPGHAVIVVDMAENAKGEKIFMLAQSYMPAQQTQILINRESDGVWYSLKGKDVLVTPEWNFPVERLRKF